MLHLCNNFGNVTAVSSQHSALSTQQTERQVTLITNLMSFHINSILLVFEMVQASSTIFNHWGFGDCQIGNLRLELTVTYTILECRIQVGFHYWEILNGKYFFSSFFLFLYGQ